MGFNSAFKGLNLLVCTKCRFYPQAAYGSARQHFHKA